MKYDLKVFWWTSVISTVLFFAIGSIAFRELIDYGNWIAVFVPVHIAGSFLVMIPLLLPFLFLRRTRFIKKHRRSVYVVTIRTGVGLIYIAMLLWTSIFRHTQQRLRDPYNYYENLNYLGLCSIISILTFAITDYFFSRNMADIN
jgi:hypothetical protein